jgi:death-on-curing protein
MSQSPKWLRVSAVLSMHDRLLAEHGGLAGVRDGGLLDSALARAGHLWHYEQPDLFVLAAAYAGGISQNHPFNDGNKRTAFTAAAAFLLINGQVVRAAEAEVVLMTTRLAEGSISDADYAAWLRDSCK